MFHFYVNLPEVKPQYILKILIHHLSQVGIIKLLGINQPPTHRKNVLAILKCVSPPQLMYRGGVINPDSPQGKFCFLCHIRSHALNTAPFKSHTELWVIKHVFFFISPLAKKGHELESGPIYLSIFVYLSIYLSIYISTYLPWVDLQ